MNKQNPKLYGVRKARGISIKKKHDKARHFRTLAF